MPASDHDSLLADLRRILTAGDAVPDHVVLAARQACASRGANGRAGPPPGDQPD
jgi:hypothetical protein